MSNIRMDGFHSDMDIYSNKISNSLKISDKNIHKKNRQKGNYLMGNTIGEGAFAKVKVGTHMQTNEKVAIKIIDKKQTFKETEDIIRVQKEINILKKLKHKNIIQLYQIMESKKNLYLVMEYCEGKELFEYIIKKKKLSETEACKFFQEIIDALEYLHENKITHRDLKPENLLLDYKKSIKISDFGLSTIKSNDDSMLQTPCGTPNYAPPEMLRGDQYNGLLSDIWSCGIILYAMLCGYLPFSESKEQIIYQRIIDHDYEYPSFLSKNAVDLLKNILKIEPSERYDIKKIKNHAWFSIVQPNMRPGINMSLINIPIDEKILKKVENLGYDKEECRSNILSNKFDSLTTIYYLCLRKYIKEGGKSISDLQSNEYMNYIKKEKADLKIENEDNNFQGNISILNAYSSDTLSRKNSDSNNSNILLTTFNKREMNNNLGIGTISEDEEYNVNNHGNNSMVKSQEDIFYKLNGLSLKEEKQVNVNDNQINKDTINQENSNNQANNKTAYMKKTTNKKMNKNLIAKRTVTINLDEPTNKKSNDNNIVMSLSPKISSRKNNKKAFTSNFNCMKIGDSNHNINLTDRNNYNSNNNTHIKNSVLKNNFNLQVNKFFNLNKSEKKQKKMNHPNNNFDLNKNNLIKNTLTDIANIDKNKKEQTIIMDTEIMPEKSEFDHKKYLEYNVSNDKSLNSEDVTNTNNSNSKTALKTQKTQKPSNATNYNYSNDMIDRDSKNNRHSIVDSRVSAININNIHIKNINFNTNSNISEYLNMKTNSLNKNKGKNQIKLGNPNQSRNVYNEAENIIYLKSEHNCNCPDKDFSKPTVNFRKISEKSPIQDTRLKFEMKNLTPANQKFNKQKIPIQTEIKRNDPNINNFNKNNKRHIKTHSAYELYSPEFNLNKILNDHFNNKNTDKKEVKLFDCFDKKQNADVNNKEIFNNENNKNSFKRNLRLKKSEVIQSISKNNKLEFPDFKAKNINPEFNNYNNSISGLSKNLNINSYDNIINENPSSICINANNVDCSSDKKQNMIDSSKRITKRNIIDKRNFISPKQNYKMEVSYDKNMSRIRIKSNHNSLNYSNNFNVKNLFINTNAESSKAETNNGNKVKTVPKTTTNIHKSHKENKFLFNSIDKGINNNNKLYLRKLEEGISKKNSNSLSNLHEFLLVNKNQLIKNKNKIYKQSNLNQVNKKHSPNHKEAKNSEKGGNLSNPNNTKINLFESEEKHIIIEDIDIPLENPHNSNISKEKMIFDSINEKINNKSLSLSDLACAFSNKKSLQSVSAKSGSNKIQKTKEFIKKKSKEKAEHKKESQLDQFNLKVQNFGKGKTHINTKEKQINNNSKKLEISPNSRIYIDVDNFNEPQANANKNKNLHNSHKKPNLMNTIKNFKSKHNEFKKDLYDLIKMGYKNLYNSNKSPNSNTNCMKTKTTNNGHRNIFKNNFNRTSNIFKNDKFYEADERLIKTTRNNYQKKMDFSEATIKEFNFNSINENCKDITNNLIASNDRTIKIKNFTDKVLEKDEAFANNYLSCLNTRKLLNSNVREESSSNSIVIKSPNNPDQADNIVSKNFNDVMINSACYNSVNPFFNQVKNSRKNFIKNELFGKTQDHVFSSNEHIIKNKISERLLTYSLKHQSQKSRADKIKVFEIHDKDNERLKNYDGPVDINFISLLQPKELMSEYTKILNGKKITFVQTNPYKFRCTKNGLSFTVEIFKLEDFNNLFYTKFKLMQGEKEYFRKTTLNFLRRD